MKKISEKAYAKINLTLDVLGKYPNGYHELEMIMQQVDLCDIVDITKISSGIKINSNDNRIPHNEDNLAYKAAFKFFEYTKINSGAEIFIQKNIPIEAGLAGGSSDAAAVLRGLNKLNDNILSESEILDIGVNIGADVPFCLVGGTALSKGIGEVLTPIKRSNNFYYVLIKPEFGISTKLVFSALNISEIRLRPDTKSAIQSIKEGNADKLATQLCNVLEIPVIKIYPEIVKLKKIIVENGALSSIMSGSGSTVFGICKNLNHANFVADKLRDKYKNVFVVKSV